jgi:hypothetical protein
MGGDHSSDIEVSDLSRRMDPGIGSTRRMNHDRMTDDVLNRFFQHFLNGSLIGLPLPTMKMSAQVLNYQGNSLSLSWVVCSHHRRTLFKLLNSNG